MAHGLRIMAARRVESREDELVLATGEHVLIQKTEGPVFGMSRDITSQKRSEEERAKVWAGAERTIRLVEQTFGRGCKQAVVVVIAAVHQAPRSCVYASVSA
jgi:hypothetical protein